MGVLVLSWFSYMVVCSEWHREVYDLSMRLFLFFDFSLLFGCGILVCVVRGSGRASSSQVGLPLASGHLADVVSSQVHEPWWLSL